MNVSELDCHKRQDGSERTESSFHAHRHSQCLRSLMDDLTNLLQRKDGFMRKSLSTWHSSSVASLSLLFTCSITPTAMTFVTDTKMITTRLITTETITVLWASDGSQRCRRRTMISSTCEDNI
ncbi:hypothetical protein L798_12896 [Zootermopsis nevadensis]|uniref:Uncharacterized protein n=1 Tax=Zootermopsis nevadensis TaxID=136037 RepID=A0A067R224_ZOONE|nr:hypothetical protein L798_12896 [Zootermopsis nevadensis]